MRRAILVIILILLLAGIVDSTYALMEHYAPVLSKACDVNETVSCTAVNQSEYSVIAGVPVAGIGVGGYLFLGVLAVAMLRGRYFRGLAPVGLVLASFLGLAFSGVFTYIELAIIKAVCPLCVISQTLMALVALLSVAVFVLWRRGTRLHAA